MSKSAHASASGGIPSENSPSAAANPVQFAAARGLRIARLDATQRLEGIQILLGGDRTATDRFLAYASQTQLRLDGLWGIFRSDGKLVLSVLAAPSAGRTATLFATSARTSADAEALASLVATACTGLVEFDVDLAQALVDPRDAIQLDAFDSSGMARLATLSYLERSLPRASAPAAPPFPDDVCIERWDPTRRSELIEALERSYIDTLDCPALAGLRRGEDILEGHLHSGKFEPALWTIMRFQSGEFASKVAGMCLLNAAHPSTGAVANVELVYLGLVPEARGRGLGRLLVAHGLAQLRGRAERGLERGLVLAVDERNVPALRLYRDAGFRTSMRRVAFIRPLRSPRAS